MQQKPRRRNSGWFKEVEIVIKLGLFYKSHTHKKKAVKTLRR